MLLSKRVASAAFHWPSDAPPFVVVVMARENANIGADRIRDRQNDAEGE